jgi:hypothetical protein
MSPFRAPSRPAGPSTPRYIFSSQRAGTPVSRARRLLRRRLANDLGGQTSLVDGWPTSAGVVLLDARQARLDKPLAPQAHRLHAGPEFLGNLLIQLPEGGHEDNLRPQDRPRRRRAQRSRVWRSLSVNTMTGAMRIVPSSSRKTGRTRHCMSSHIFESLH